MNRLQRGYWIVGGLVWKELLSVLMVLSMVVSGLEGSSTTKVVTKFGPVIGMWSRSTRGRLVAQYLGIPYAEPPVGDLRFRSPQPWKRTWNETYSATEYGNMCIQLGKGGQIHGNEDCLYLNIYVPIISEKREENRGLPVMVFIHGGIYISGSSRMFPPNYLMDQNVILVTPNYRLNILGFLSTSSKASPGNYGLKDIRMALKWVQENIASFHGDPNSVTLWGHSSGSSTVHLLALSSKTDGLFHRYIVQSGFAICPWALNAPRWARLAGFQVARTLGCLPEKEKGEEEEDETTSEGHFEGNSTTVKPEETTEKEENYLDEEEEYDEEQEEEMMSCLRNIEANKIVPVLLDLYVWRENPCCLFGPTIEEDSEDAIITMPPLVTIKNRLYKDIPFIMGVVQDEGLIKTDVILVHESMQDELVDNFDRYLPLLTNYYQLISNTSEFATAIEDFYFGGNVSRSTLVQNITEVLTDAAFFYAAQQMLNYQSEVMNSNSYFYLFSYQGTFSHTFLTGSLVHYGVSHVDDLNYLLPVLNLQFKDQMLHNSESDITMINIMTEMWANFAAKGVPEAWRVTPWPNYKDSHEFLRFGDGKSTNITVENVFFPERIKFWEELIYNLTMDSVYIDLTIAPTIEGELLNTGISHKHDKLQVFLLILFVICL
ncbi:PREDICTED: esterase FE4-like, partial [Habropoda laboriosa]|uniref:esterase FE4-like n=1 Tax=Habropoda laboriosa TaxID=597456 RepID=UPI00083E3267